MKIIISILVLVIVGALVAGGIYLQAKDDMRRKDVDTKSSILVLVGIALVLIGFPLIAFLSGF